ncbi:hypothetical protein D1872_304120 [compost metagenome]
MNLHRVLFLLKLSRDEQLFAGQPGDQTMIQLFLAQIREQGRFRHHVVQALQRLARICLFGFGIIFEQVPYIENIRARIDFLAFEEVMQLLDFSQK